MTQERSTANHPLAPQALDHRERSGQALIASRTGRAPKPGQRVVQARGERAPDRGQAQLLGPGIGAGPVRHQPLATQGRHGVRQAFLDQQNEIASRHTRAKKNLTDGVQSTSAEVPMRYLIALIVPITVTVEDFLRRAASPDDDVAAMLGAWFKAVTLTAALWTQPYAGGW